MAYEDQKDVIFDTTTVKYVGIFSFSELYAHCKKWIMSEIDPNEFEEGNYSEKTPSSGKLIDITWTFKKKFTNYFAFTGSIKFRTVNMKKVEVERDGKKIQMDQGEVYVKIKGHLVRDYKNQFNDSKMRQKLRGIYNKWIIGSKVDKYEGKIIDLSERFLASTKEFLELEGKR